MSFTMSRVLVKRPIVLVGFFFFSHSPSPPNIWSQYKEWEVAEVHLGGLPRDADEKYLRDMIHSQGGQIVSAKLELDPVLHTCKGRAKLVMRYNPAHYDINALIRELESHNLVVFF